MKIQVVALALVAFATMIVAEEKPEFLEYQVEETVNDLHETVRTSLIYGSITPCAAKDDGSCFKANSNEADPDQCCAYTTISG